MALSEIIRPDAVRVVSSVPSKKRLIQAVGDIANAVYGIDAISATDSLLERESLGPTGVGKGIALPHARLTGINGVIGVFLRIEKPVEFDAVDRQPVDLIFGLFAPRDSGVDHLKALAQVSRTLRDQAVCEKLRSNSNVATLHAVLTDPTMAEMA